MKRLLVLFFLIIFSLSVFALDSNMRDVNSNYEYDDYDEYDDSDDDYDDSNELEGFCTEEYDPVCAQVQVQCVKAPCDPIEQTFSNKCFALNAGAKILYEGKCEIDSPERICGGIDYSKAKEIALRNCGEITGVSFCNEETKTWWFDLDMEMTGCAPACVVNTMTGNAEINYRCTGLLPEPQEVTEYVKCLFNDNENEQKCYGYANEQEYECNSPIGWGACSVQVKGTKGEKITWKSSCGGYAYTVIDGDSEYAKFDCSDQVAPDGCFCTKEYDPVCGEVKVCNTKCEEEISIDTREEAYTKASCQEYCYIEKKTFGNKCVAACEGVENITSGECRQDTCERYEMPDCKDGKIVVVRNDDGCEYPKCVESQSDFYTAAKWTCSDGSTSKIEGDCMPRAYWKEYARRQCESRIVKCAPTQTNTSTQTNPVGIVANFFLDIMPSSNNDSNLVDSNADASVQTTKCIGGKVYLQDYEVLNPCDTGCETSINENGCKEIRCANGDTKIICGNECQKPPYEEIRALKDKCYNNAGEVLIKTDDKGCEYYSCSINDKNECLTVEDIPREKYISCEEYGGKILMKTNDDGCITVLECVGEKKIDLNASINKNILTDQTKLLSLAINLETLKMEVGKIRDKLSSIAEYYADKGDLNYSNKYEKAIELLLDIEAKIDSARQLIKDNVSNFDEEKAIQLRELIKTIREEKLKEVLMVLLE